MYTLFRKNCTGELTSECWLDFATTTTVDYIPFLAKNYLAKRFKLDKRKKYVVYNLGSNTREVSDKLQVYFPKFRIIDIDLAPLAKSKVSASFLQADLHHLPFKTNSADLLWASYVLFYVKNRNQVVQEWQRVLKKGGQGLAILHSPFSEILNEMKQSQLFNLKTLLTTYQTNLHINNIHRLPAELLSWLTLKLDLEPTGSLQMADILHSIEQRIARYNYFLKYAPTKLFKTPEEIQTFFKKFGFKNIEVELIQSTAALVQTSKQPPQKVKHDGWLVTFGK